MSARFSVFTDGFHTWWPREHHVNESGLDTVVLEAGVGGRWFERGVDGTECDWGRVLLRDLPRHVAMTWQLDPDWNVGVPEAMASRVDVRFESLGDSRTRVELVHDGFANHGAGWERIRDGVGAAGGWAGILASFGSMVT